jgi:hypothetical protein
MKVFPPLHMTPNWISRDLAEDLHEGHSGQGARRKTYIHPKTISIRQYIARAEKLKTL